MNGAPIAELRVSTDVRPGREVFIATRCDIDGPWVHVEGQWRRRTGLNFAEIHWSNPSAYTWTATDVVAIKWLNDELAERRAA